MQNKDKVLNKILEIQYIIDAAYFDGALTDKQYDAIKASLSKTISDIKKGER